MEHLEQLHQERQATQQRVEEATREFNRGTEALEKHLLSLQHKQRELDQTAQKVEEKHHALQQHLEGRDLTEYRREKDALLRELALLQRIAALEDQRALLQEGEPCPLCGATEHPYAGGDTPALNETETRIAQLGTLIDTAEHMQQQIESLNATLEQVRTETTRMETEAATLRHARSRAQEHKGEHQNAFTQLDQRNTELLKILQDRVEAFGGQFDPADPHQSVNHLSLRVEAWQTLEQQHTALTNDLSRARAEVARLDAVLETRSNTLKEKQQELEEVRTGQVRLQQQRHTLFGDKNPSEVERRMQHKVEAGEQEQTQAQTRLNQAQQRRGEISNRSEALIRQLDERHTELEHLEEQFRRSREGAGFTTEAAFEAARLEPQGRQRLEQQHQRLQQHHLELQTRERERHAKLEQERALNLTSATIEELEQQRAQLKKELEELRGISAGLKHQLREHAAAKERIRDKEAAIRAQRQQCLKWERLHGLIGSADGKKFRNFAQGLTFDLMINHANAQLSRMNERYLLVRDTAQALELNVVDNYQAGRSAPRATSPGGEVHRQPCPRARTLQHGESQYSDRLPVPRRRLRHPRRRDPRNGPRSFSGATAGGEADRDYLPRGWAQGADSHPHQSGTGQWR